jgi:chemotaxis protein CheC
MDEAVLFDQKVLEKMKSMACEGVNSAAYGFSKMVGHKIVVGQPTMRVVPLLEIPKIVGGPGDDAVGIYLRFKGDLIGQIMIIVPFEKVSGLVDLLMGAPTGTTQELGSLEKSALGELGNLCGTFFLNALAKSVDASLRPSPPAVMVDMVGAILDIVVATSGKSGESVLLVQADLTDEAGIVDAAFWATPDMVTLQNLINKNVSE